MSAAASRLSDGTNTHIDSVYLYDQAFTTVQRNGASRFDISANEAKLKSDHPYSDQRPGTVHVTPTVNVAGVTGDSTAAVNFVRRTEVESDNGSFFLKAATTQPLNAGKSVGGP